MVEVQRPRSGDREVAYRTVALPGRGEATVEWRTAGLTRGRHPLGAAVVRTPHNRAVFRGPVTKD